MSEVFHIEKIMGVCSRLWQGIGLNFLFLLSNIPLVWFILAMGIDQIGTYLPLFCLCLVPLGPSFCALFYSMKRLMEEGDIKVWRIYRKGYGINGKQGIFLSLAEALVFFILNVNLKAFTQVYPSFTFALLFQLMLLLLVLITPNLYLLAMWFQVSLSAVVKNAIIITLGKPVLTLGNFAALMFALVLYDFMPGAAILVLGSVYAFLILFMNKKILMQLGKKD